MSERSERDIFRDICVDAGLTRDEVMCRKRGSRRAIIVEARQRIMRALRERRMSFPIIGKRMGGFDHTTVLHACRKTDIPWDTLLPLKRGKDFVASWPLGCPWEPPVKTLPKFFRPAIAPDLKQPEIISDRPEEDEEMSLLRKSCRLATAALESAHGANCFAAFNVVIPANRPRVAPPPFSQWGVADALL